MWPKCLFKFKEYSMSEHSEGVKYFLTRDEKFHISKGLYNVLFVIFIQAPMKSQTISLSLPKAPLSM